MAGKVTDMRYLRFGEIPKDGKSVNFLKLTRSQNEDFAYACEVGSYEEAIEDLPEDAFEAGLSVFEIDENGMLKLDNLQLVSSMLARIDAKVYEVSGEQVGTGNDGEPLIEVEKVEKKRRISREKLISHAISTICKNFKNAEFNRNADVSDCRLHSFYVEQKININTGKKVSIWNDVKGDEWVNMPPYREYTACGWAFSNPVDGFDVNLGIKRKGGI